MDGRAASLEQRWPRRQVAPDLEREASRLLRWAQEDAWGPSGTGRGPQPKQAPGIPVRPGPSPAQASSVLGGPQEDPWETILATGDEDFVEVPTHLLERLRRAGEAQLAEITELRAQLAQLPYVEDEIHQMEQELAELQTTIVVNANEIELRNMEAESMASEGERLEATKAERKARLDSLTAQAGEIEFWLDAAGHAPVGAEGRARVERYKAAARAAAEASAESEEALAAHRGSVTSQASQDVVLRTAAEWQELCLVGELSDAERAELADFFHRLDPAGPAGGRLLTEAEVQAAAGNPKSGLPKALRGRLLDALRAPEAPARPSPATALPAVPVELEKKPAEDTLPAPEPAKPGDDGEQSDQSNPDGAFTLAEWRDFFREEGSFSTEEFMQVTGVLSDLPWPSQKKSLAQLRTALGGPLANLSAELKAKMLKLLEDADDEQDGDSKAEAPDDEASDDGGFTKEEWMDFFREDGDLKEEEMEVLDSLLVKMDVSGDGRVSSDEIKAALARTDLEMPEAVRSKLVEFMEDVE